MFQRRAFALVVLAFLQNACGGNEIPKGQIQKLREHRCDADPLRERMLSSSNPAERSHWIAEFLEDCEEYLSRGDSSALFQLINLGGTQYDYGDHRGFREIELPRRTRSFTTARLGLQEGVDKRPLIILDCGMQCDLDRPSMKRLIMFLFDEGPFHVLALPSNSSQSYIKRNGVFSIGGLEEGYSFHRVAGFMKNRSKWKDRISSVHVLGISLGGHAALYASLYASSESNRDAISSYIAACPVVDLKQSLEELYQPSIVGDFALKRFRKSVEELADRASNLQEALDELTGKIRFDRVKEIIEDASVIYYQQEGNRWLSQTTAFRGQSIETTDDFWSLSQFQNFASDVDQPVYIWAAKNDNVVDTVSNALALQKLIGEHPSIQINITNVGGHCTFWDSFGWFNTGELLRASILSHSPELQKRRTKIKMTIPYSSEKELRKSTERLRNIEWAVSIDRPVATLEIAYDYWSNYGGYSFNRTVRTEFPLTDLGISIIPANNAERQALRRKLNSTYRIWGEKNGSIDRYESPKQIEWFEYL